MELAGVRVGAALALVLVLSGCVSTVAPPAPGFSQEEIDKYRAQSSVVTAEDYGLPEGSLPAPEDVIFVSLDDWGFAVVDCLSRAGFEGYRGLPGGGYSWSDSGTQTVEEAQANVICQLTYAVDPLESGVLNEAELAYLYDFYREITVPCLRLAGLTILDAPTKADFVKSGGAWAPSAAMEGDLLSTFEVGKSPWYRSTPDNDLAGRCATWPEGWDRAQNFSGG